MGTGDWRLATWATTLKWLYMQVLVNFAEMCESLVNREGLPLHCLAPCTAFRLQSSLRHFPFAFAIPSSVQRFAPTQD
jgi:hypothetical protein